MAIRVRKENGVGMLAVPDFLRVDDGKITARAAVQFSSDQRDIIRKLNGRISFGNGEQSSQSGNIDGQWIEIVFPATPDEEVTVPHGLGRLPCGYIVMLKDRAADVYVSRFGSWGKDTMYLKCNVASATISLVVV